MQASDRFNINSQLEHLQAKYVGTGHADQGRFEWAVNINRDSYAMFIGRHSMLAYIAISENESIGRERYNFMQKSLSCGTTIRGSIVTGPLHNYMYASDTDTSRSVSEPFSDNGSDGTVSPPVRFSICRTAEAVLVDLEESSDPSKTVPNTGLNHDNIPEPSETDNSRTVLDTEPYSDNIPDTSETASDSPLSQSVQSSPFWTAEAVPSDQEEAMPSDQEELSDPSKNVSDTEPYHDNMPDTSKTLSGTRLYDDNMPDTADTNTSKTVSDTPVSQSVRSSPYWTAETVLVDLEESSDPRKTVPDTGPNHDNIPDTSETDNSRTVLDTEPCSDNIPDTSETASDAPLSQSVQSSPFRTAEAVPAAQEEAALSDQEELSDPSKNVSDTEPYHDNMPDTADTNTSKTVSDTPVSQSVRSSPYWTENASPV